MYIIIVESLVGITIPPGRIITQEVECSLEFQVFLPVFTQLAFQRRFTLQTLQRRLSNEDIVGLRVEQFVLHHCILWNDIMTFDSNLSDIILNAVYSPDKQAFFSLSGLSKAARYAGKRDQLGHSSRVS